jgi:hypothetical protein
MTHSKNLQSGVLEKNLQKDMQQIAESPRNMIAWMGSLWAVADLISIPLGNLLKTEVIPEELVGVLTEVQEKLVNFPLRGDIVQYASLHEAFEPLLISPLDTVDEKFIKAIEKVDSITKGIKSTAKKLNYKELNLLLGLVSALTKLYTIHLNQKKIEPSELLKLIKVKTELTLKTHLSAIPLSFSRSDFATENPGEIAEIHGEIRDEISTRLSLLSITNNDIIYDELLHYKQKINDLMEIYEFRVEGFEEEINRLMHECKPLIEHKEKMREQAISLIKEHSAFLNTQLEKLDAFYLNYQKKFSKESFDKFLKPEFEKEINSILKQIKYIEKASKELTLDKKFHIEPFTVLTIEEQRAFYDKIVKKTQKAEKNKIIERINYVCRQPTKPNR